MTELAQPSKTQIAQGNTAQVGRISVPYSLTRRRLLLVALLVGVIGLFLLDVALGSVSIPVGDVVTILTGGEPARATWTNIVLRYRLPKALTASLAGAALAVAGLQMQTLFRNPLADPFSLGINSGASLGVSLVVLGAGGAGVTFVAGLSLLGDLSLAFAAMFGAALVMGLVMVVARWVDSAMTLLLLGLMFGYAASAVVSVMLYFSMAERVQAYVLWTMGSFGSVTWSQMRVLAPAIIVGLALAYVSIKALNALLLGETYAASMGLTVRRARLIIVTGASILAGVVTAFCGPIGFLGIAVPHLCRSFFETSDHRTLVPATALMGALLALVADLIAHMPFSQAVLPLNAITALIGAPVVVWVILRRRNARRVFGT